MSNAPAVRVIEAIFAAHWAMTEDYLRTMLEIAARNHEISPEALEAMRGRRVAEAENGLTLRDGVGIIPVRGPMFRYADFFSSISGATTYEGLALDFRRAADDNSMRSILVEIDSPGGEVNGVQELAGQIRAIDRGRKPVVAYVSGTGASAAYLIAAAAREVVAAPNAVLGSIGVRAAIRDTSQRDERLGVRTIEFVSSQSPNKRADPNTDEGRLRIQATIDALAESFIRHVAELRGITAEEVVSLFGAGGVQVGDGAVAAGMADRLGSFETTLLELARGQAPPILLTHRPKGLPIMAKTPEEIAAEQAAIATARTEGTATGAASALARVQAILLLESAKGREDQAKVFAFSTDLAVDKVDALLKAGPAAAPPAAPPVPKPAEAGRRAGAADGGLVHASVEEHDKALPPVKIDREALYDKFSGKRAA